MKINKSIKLGIFFLIGILLLTSFVMAYYRSQTNYVQYGPYDRTGLFGTAGMFDDRKCQAGQDFILQVSPLGCEPAMVRSDLLEEQNVPVFCPISATQMNPLIDVQAINSMTITGRYPKEVATVGFHPAQGALNQYQNELTQPVILDNIGYAVIVLKKQENESAMPDYIEGNLTARIRYDIQNAFGVGQSSFYLPVLDENDWAEKYKQYSFWDGRGYLRAEGVYDNQATISIYSDQSRSGILGHGDEKMLYQAPITLTKGETSNELYIPGFDFCLATMRIRLDDLENPDERARFRVNGNPVEVKQGEWFLDNNCKVINLEKNGINSEVELNCKEDREGIHKGSFELKITPNISLEINGDVVNKSVGDYLEMNEDGTKKVFLAYAGTVGNTRQEEDLFVYLMAIPEGEHPSFTLTLDEMEAARKIVDKLELQNVGDESIYTILREIGEFYIGNYLKFWNWLRSGDNFKRVSFTQKNIEKFGNEINIIGFAGASDAQLPEEVKDEFNAAIDDYREIVNNYPDEDNPDVAETLGESALYELIGLANELNQKITMSEYCEEFEQRYPNSRKSLEVCKDGMKISSSTSSVTEVLIDNHVYQISFEGIYQPTEYEYSAKVKVNFPGGDVSTYTLTKNDVVYLDTSENEYIQLEDLEENSAQLNLNIKKKTNAGNFFDPTAKSEWILLNAPQSFNSGYTLTLIEVNLKKVAKVSLIPNIDYAQTNASFNFRVNIDKRDIQLSPEKTQEKIDNLEESIEKWGKVSNTLWKFVQTMKYACLGTSAALTVKNYVQNVGGKGIARDSVMNGEYGWYERCDDWVAQGVVRPNGKGKAYTTQEKCLIEESDNINADVDAYYEFMSTEQDYIKNISKVLSKEGLFSQQTINTSALAYDLSKDVKTNLDSLGTTFQDPEGKGEAIDISEMKKVLSQEGYDQNKYEIEQLRDIDIYVKVLNNSDDERLREMAKQNLYATFLDIQVNSREYRALQDLSSKYGASEVILGSSKWLDEYPLSNPSTFGEVKNKNSFTGASSIDSSAPVVIYKDQSNAKEYLFILDDDYVITQTYLINGNALSAVDENNINPLRIGFDKYNDASYKNEYDNPEVRYYETEPYKGYPAIVPFDLKEGWYVAVKQNLPVFGGIASYSESGRVESYYLCNVGRNGREENLKGDDICRSINSISGEPIDQFPGISDKGKVVVLIRKASDAVYQAQQEYETGVRKVTINGKSINVGNPAVDLPGTQCQDFMSPKDCNVLFNVCDPVVCPSSRCDFGGKYPVQDVVQSGIIGSIALCLPNAQEGIYVPVCLTGVQAGLDGLLSIFGSYQDCLQESLDTGQTIGICDEIQSVYLCEYFYRQALPIAKLGIPKLTELLVGKGSRGGGEYLGVTDAWQRAESSVGYFVQYYAQNSYKAFKARSIEEAGQEIVCDEFLSLSYPGGNLLDAITTPDSPVQFYGRFDEIPYTTVTNPPQSQYKVFYHIYAGKDRGSYYRVYFKGGAGSSFYQDTMFKVDVATGYIGRGDSVSDTKDFTAPSGYKELCILVNGQEECGFKEVTTNFAVNYVRDSYVAQQTSQTDIKTESDCISGTSSLYSLLNPNLQAGAEQALNPAIYNEGVIRICATRNPGEGTDSKVGEEGSRWVDVGYCGDMNLKCWLDTKSVENAIDFKNIEENVLNVTNQNYQDVLMGQGGYLTFEEFNNEVIEIKNSETSNQEKVNLVTNIIDKVFYNNQKASLLYLRGNAYKALAIALYEEYFKEFENKCDVRGKEKCDISGKIMRCSSTGEWEFSGIDCSILNQICTTGGTNKAECISREEADKIIFGEEEEIDVYEELSDYESLKFVLDRGVFNQEICYRYFDNQWHWSSDCDKIGTKKYVTPNFRTSVPEVIYTYDWIPVSTLENPYGGEPSNSELEFIKTLQNKVFSEGFSLLIDRTLLDNGATLSTTQITFYERGLFELSLSRAGDNLYFKFGDNKWYWGFAGSAPILGERKNSWVASPGTNDLVTSISPHIAYQRIILLLEGKNFYEGAKFLFLESIEDSEEVEEQLKEKEKVEEFLDNPEAWKSWEDVKASFNTNLFDNTEKGLILNAKSCEECGKGIWNRCEKEECIAIGFKLRDSLKLEKICSFTGLWGCEEVSIKEETPEEIENIPSGETCPAPPEVTPEIKAINSPNLKVLKKIEQLAGTSVPKNLDADSNGVTNCFDPAKHVYDSAGVWASCIYSDRIGTEYNIFGTTIETDSASKDPFPAFAVNENSCSVLGKSGSDKLAVIDKGYLLSYAYDSTQGHSVIFVGWDPAPPMAKVFGWKKSGTGHIFDYSTVDLSDNSHPVYMMWEPKLKSS